MVAPQYERKSKGGEIILASGNSGYSSRYLLETKVSILLLCDLIAKAVAFKVYLTQQAFHGQVSRAVTSVKAFLLKLITLDADESVEFSIKFYTSLPRFCKDQFSG